MKGIIGTIITMVCMIGIGYVLFFWIKPLFYIYTLYIISKVGAHMVKDYLEEEEQEYDNI